MASLLVAAGLLTFNKVKDKRAAKKEAKRQAYENRYNELEREHSQNQEQRVQTRQTGSMQGTEHISSATTTATARTEPQQQDPFSEKRRSSDSERGSIHSRDDPRSWVDDALRDREKQSNRTS